MARKRQRRGQQEQRLDPKTARIAIIGSGLAGLSTAISLERQGFTQITVYERDASFDHRSDGFGLTLSYNPKGVLAQLGVLQSVADADCPSRSHYLFDWRGAVMGYFGRAFSQVNNKSSNNNSNNNLVHESWGQRGNLRVPRQQVRQILLDQLKCSVVLWNHKLVDIQTKKKTNGVDDSSSVVELVFQQGSSNNNNDNTLVVAEADFVVGADGIHSTLVQKWLPDAPLPKPMGIRIIVGLTDNNFAHALLHERGFYTLASGQRLFVMPYSAPSLIDPDQPLRYMWQLSFAASDSNNDNSENDGDKQDSNNYNRNQSALLQEALALTQNWHEPVPSMIRSTPAASIWGTHLCDRDPTVLQQLLLQKLKQQQQSHGGGGAAAATTTAPIVLVGDALHAMSPFKGQGANQSLADGITVASWLTRASPTAAVRGSLREMVQRTSRSVLASRQAAHHWHAPDTWCGGRTNSRDPNKNTDHATHNYSHSFAASVDAAALTAELRARGITAETTDLDAQVAAVVRQMSLKDGSDDEKSENEKESDLAVDDTIREKVIQAVATGDRATLRELSWRHPNLLRRMGSAALQAVAEGDQRMLHWLVTEAGCQPDT